MSIISCDSVSLSYGTKEILKSVSFSVNDGDKVGIIGINGAGKSTLFRIITAQTEPTSGSVYIRKDASIGMLEQIIDYDFKGKDIYTYAVSAFDSLIDAENQLDSLAARVKDDPKLADEYDNRLYNFKLRGGAEYKTKTKSFLARFGFRADSYSFPAEKLSGGQKTRLALCRLLLSDNDIILLDEPTNHLDIDTVEWLEDFIHLSSKTFLIVSHDRYFLDRVTNCTVEIENLTAVKYDGGYSVFKEKKKKLLEDREKHYELQQKEIKRLEAFIENQRKWNRERNIIAAESRQKAIDRMVKVEKPKNAPKNISFSISSNSGSNDVLSVRNLSKSFDTVLFSNLSFEVKKGDRLMIIGSNGCGKSTLLKIINGMASADSGVCELGYAQTVGYYDQEIQQLNEYSTVIDELLDVCEDMLPAEARSVLARFGFYGDDVFKEISLLSGGEKARLSIARLVQKNVSLLLLDEPTNHLDIPSKEILESALSEYTGTLIAVSHDRYFIHALANRILEIDRNGYDCGWFYFKGDFDSFLAKRIKKSPEAEQSAPKASKDEYLTAKREKAQKRYNQKRYTFLSEEIPRLEEREKQIEAEMMEKASDYKAVTALSEEDSLVKETLEKYYAEYFSLEEEVPE